MRIHFFIRFHTNPGESLGISGNVCSLGNNDPSKAAPLSYFDNNGWHGTFEVDAAEAVHIKYKYILRINGHADIQEGGNDRVIDISKKGLHTIRVCDIWNNPAEYENVFYTAPFKNVLLKENITAVKKKSPRFFTHIFKIKAPLLKKHEAVCIAGSGVALQEWSIVEPLLLSRDDNWWSIKMDLAGEHLPMEYKYGIYDIKKKSFSGFEKGANRMLYPGTGEEQLTILQDGFLQVANNTWRGAGVAIPVFSLRTKNGFGVGEFADIALLADWAAETGLKVIQILPVNDTTATNSWKDSYPYAAISAFALHPIYINLEKVAGKKFADILKPLKKKQKELNDRETLDYEEVMRTKIAVMKVLFAAQKEELFKDEGFRDFFDKSKHWLVPYAAFCYLRDENRTSDSSQWKLYSTYDQASIEKYVSPRSKHYNDIATHYFIQYHLHLQLREASDYAHKKGVILKGDIPIGIYRYSCDAWVNPASYKMSEQAGAPPDAFAVKGQNWGFPTYNWRQMEQEGYLWWRQRFEQMSYYFDAFRIDHILGFFRIWSIPIHAVEGIMGHFEPSIPVYTGEFEERRIWFDLKRYTEPYIDGQFLNDLFGEDLVFVQQEFLDSNGDDRYALKEAFNTQRKVEAWSEQSGNKEKEKRIKTGLYDLISNVILLPAPFVKGDVAEQGKWFHFRISMEDTYSYKSLDWQTKHQLKELYVNYFYERQDDFWKTEALRKLPALKTATDMLVCGEDLGMVPASVPDVMKALNILSLEIQRMPKDSKLDFFHPHQAPYLSVVTPSTHDMSTIRGWWEEDKYVTQHFYNMELGQQGQAPPQCEPWISRIILHQHLYSPAILSIFQLQDLTGVSETLCSTDPRTERINDPANNENYWRYRIPFTLEHLLKEKHFNGELKEYIKASGRN